MPNFTLTDKLLLTLYVIVLAAAYVLYALWAVRFVKLNQRLRRSRILVRLKSGWLGYAFLLAILSAVLGVFLYLTLKGNQIKECVIFSLIIAGFMGLLLLMSFGKSAVVDDGVFVGNRFIPWNKCYDYYIDKEKCVIAFSNNVKGGLTLVGTTFPKRFDRRDTDKLLEILESKKAQFLNNVVVR